MRELPIKPQFVQLPTPFKRFQDYFCRLLSVNTQNPTQVETIRNKRSLRVPTAILRSMLTPSIGQPYAPNPQKHIPEIWPAAGLNPRGTFASSLTVAGLLSKDPKRANLKESRSENTSGELARSFPKTLSLRIRFRHQARSSDFSNL